MTTLYDLQAAVANAVADGNFARGSDNLLDQLKKSREMFRADWEEYILFLQRCRGYADDYMALCKFASTHPPSQSVAPSTEMLATAKKLVADTQVLRSKHERDFTELRQHQSSLVYLFRRSSTVTVKNRTRPANGGKWFRSNLHVMKHTNHIILDKPRSNSVDPTLHQFVQAAEASLRPDGPKAFQAAEKALNAIHTSLRDFTAVWEGQTDHLYAVLSKPDDALPKPQELKNLMLRWGRYRQEIQAAVSSISASSDAATVDAVGATQTKKTKDNRTPSFWQRFFRTIKY